MPGKNCWFSKIRSAPVSTTAATIGLVDLNAVYVGVPKRYRPKSTWLAAPTYTVAIKALGATLGSETTAAAVGQVGVVRRALDPEGQVMIDGELWRAVAADGPVPAGEAVEVAKMDGLTLTVTRKPRPS